MALMLSQSILDEVKKRGTIPTTAQKDHASGKISSGTSFTNLNKTFTSLTTLAQLQKKSGSSNIRITNGLASELSNVASSTSKASKSYLTELSSGINSALSLLSSNVKASKPVTTSGGTRGRPTSVFVTNRPTTQTPTHPTYQESVIQPHEASNI